MTPEESAREVCGIVDVAIRHAVAAGADIAFACMIEVLKTMPESIHLTPAQWAVIVSTARDKAAK